MEAKKVIKIASLCLASIVLLIVMGVGIYVGVYASTPNVPGREIFWSYNKQEILDKESVQFEEIEIPYANDDTRTAVEALISEDKVDFMGHDATLVYIFNVKGKLIDVRYIIQSDSKDQRDQKLEDIFNKCNEKYELASGDLRHSTWDWPDVSFVNKVQFKELKENFKDNHVVNAELTMKMSFVPVPHILIAEDIFGDYKKISPNAICVSFSTDETDESWKSIHYTALSINKGIQE